MLVAGQCLAEINGSEAMYKQETITSHRVSVRNKTLKSSFLPQDEIKGSKRKLPLPPLEAALPILNFRFFVNSFFFFL